MTCKALCKYNLHDNILLLFDHGSILLLLLSNNCAISSKNDEEEEEEERKKQHAARRSIFPFGTYSLECLRREKTLAAISIDG